MCRMTREKNLEGTEIESFDSCGNLCQLHHFQKEIFVKDRLHDSHQGQKLCIFLSLTMPVLSAVWASKG